MFYSANTTNLTANTDYGRITLPTEVGAEEATLALITRMGADAVRNSDGTALPENMAGRVEKIYATRFVARGDQEWALAHPEHGIRQYLLSERVTATSDTLSIDPLAGYFRRQFELCLFDDPKIYWEVRDRTTGTVVNPQDWDLDAAGIVHIRNVQLWHEYTVAFLALQIWDGTQMYNFITNDWDENKVARERPYDIRYEETWKHVKSELVAWMDAHPEINVVRFTTFFYHFTLVFNDNAKEKYVDWFGYSASVSAPALEAFSQEYGYRLTPEDFVDEGYYNSAFRTPTKRYLDWVEFQSRFVATRVKELVDLVHATGKEAMMFLGDNWIGTEPYGSYFPDCGLDAVVGSFGSAATTRMISDIPGVRYTEGRMLPYFFPDTFYPGGDPLTEAKLCWASGRRANLRKPLDRIGYGGYVSLALQFPEFIDYTVEIANEFRQLHQKSRGTKPWVAPVKVAMLNAWGKRRTWMTEMVAHAIDFKQTRTYQGVVESLAGLPVDVDFISFTDVIENGVPEDIDVLVIEGAYGTAFSGGPIWENLQLLECLRAWVAGGGALIGVGHPSAWISSQGRGRTFQLSDIFGVDQELGYGLSTDKYVQVNPNHYVAQDLCSGDIDVGEGARDVYPLSGSAGAKVLRFGGYNQASVNKGEVQLAINEYGDGRAVYIAGLPYSPDNARLLLRSILWSGKAEQESLWWSSDPGVDIAVFTETGYLCVANSTLQQKQTVITGPGGFREKVELGPVGYKWLKL